MSGNHSISALAHAVLSFETSGAVTFQAGISALQPESISSVQIMVYPVRTSSGEGPAGSAVCGSSLCRGSVGSIGAEATAT